MVLPYNPYATFMGGYRRETTSQPAATGFQYQLHIEQPIEIAGQRGARLRAVDTAVAAAQATTEYARSQTRAVLRVAYVQAVLGEQRVEVARRREETAQRLLESAVSRSQLGAASDIEVNLAQIEVGRVAGDLAEAQVGQEVRLSDLRLLTGIAAGTPLLLSTHQTEPPVLAAEHEALPQLLDLALQHRADLVALRRQRQALAAERGRLRREAVPSPVLAFDHQRDLPGQDFWGGTLGLQLPLWNRNQGPLAQVRAQEQARQTEEQLLVARVRNEVTLAYRALELRRGQARRFQQMVLPPAERNLDLLRRGWQAGKFDLFRVITASRELSETRLRYLDILDDLWVAMVELERAVGAPLPAGDRR
jgi:cobalt-zinc-cadmium efflux system outer membrane protein